MRRSNSLLPMVLLLASLPVSIGILGCRSTGNSRVSDVPSSGDALVLDSLGKALVGSWYGSKLISNRKEFRNLKLNKKGTYVGTNFEDETEEGIWTASAASKSLTLTPSKGSSRTYGVLSETPTEMQLALPKGGDPEKFADSFVLEEESSDKPDEGGSNCGVRTGGAFISFSHVGEKFTFWTFNQAFIAKAKAHMKSGQEKVPLFYPVADKACEPELLVDPNKMEWADLTTEVCDGKLTDRETLFKSPGSWCPWGTKVTKVDER